MYAMNMRALLAQAKLYTAAQLLLDAAIAFLVAESVLTDPPLKSFAELDSFMMAYFSTLYLRGNEGRAVCP